MRVREGKKTPMVLKDRNESAMWHNLRKYTVCEQ